MSWDSTTATRRLAGLPEPEPLHPDLAARLVRRAGRLPALEHPLIVQAPYIPPLASYVNGLYESLRQRAEALLVARNFDSWLDLHSRPHRAEVLVLHADRIEHDTWWSLLASVFRSDPPWHDDEPRHWTRALSSDKPQRTIFMTRQERELLDTLPAMISVWRAVPAADPQSGISLFLDRETAQDFAREAVEQLQLESGDFVLQSARIPRSRVLAASLARGMPELLAADGTVEGVTPV
ncbi:MAG: hypothetical protein KIT73_03510 [Burkholderiales bacterium]|nr:hypothetical protein [Burkholderiales bacterium]